MHSEICPVCQGVGERLVPDNQLGGSMCNYHMEICKGCNGMCWVSVSDEYILLLDYNTTSNIDYYVDSHVQEIGTVPSQTGEPK